MSEVQNATQGEFTLIQWIAPEVSPEGIQELGEEYWQAWLTYKPIMIITTELS